MQNHSLSSPRPRHLIPLLLLLAGIACQGRGRVHETLPASYPDDDPAVLESRDRPSEPLLEPPPPQPARQDGYAAPPFGEPGRDAEESDFPRAEAKARSESSPEPPTSAAAGSSAGRERSADAASPSAGVGGGPLWRRPAPEKRPGLATHWGESHYSPTREVDFVRRSERHPVAVVELRYDDRAGARRMFPEASWDRAETSTLGGLRIRVVDSAGQSFPALRSRAALTFVGAPDERYWLAIENGTAARYEVVASVDGLDVIDGEDASFEKRGYLVAPYSSVLIDGFRRSDAEVAAFRLGDVSGSYAASKGKARNVGVLGFAFFDERRTVIQPPPWPRPLPSEDTRLRRDAEPFPGRYARPPVW
jgi:hypothetical protein